MNRETIFAALFERLSSTPGLVTKSRRLVHWADVPAVQQPALYLAKGAEVISQQTGQPSVVTMRATVWVYAMEKDPDAAPSTILNGLLDGIQAAVAPSGDPTKNKQTLGGLVHHCWINGNIETDEGTLGDQTVAILNIDILTTV